MIEKTVIVADSSPLIALAVIEQLALLPQLCSIIINQINQNHSSNPHDERSNNYTRSYSFLLNAINPPDEETK
jgi:hypothetical protein